jgi:hypothetical protein
VPALVRRLSPRWAHATWVALFGAALLCAGDVVGLGQEIMMFRFTSAKEVPGVRAPRFYYGGEGLASDFIDQPKQNRAYTGCRSYEWSFHADAPVWTGDVPQARASGETGTIEQVSRTQNTFTVDVDARAPTRVLLNSAYDVGWQSTVGSVVDVSGQLAVDVPEGHHHLVARYWPRRLTLGFWLSGLTLLGALAFLARRPLLARLRRR